MDLDARRRHLYIIGKTGMGKTTHGGRGGETMIGGGGGEAAVWVGGSKGQTPPTYLGQAGQQRKNKQGSTESKTEMVKKKSVGGAAI